MKSGIGYRWSVSQRRFAWTVHTKLDTFLFLSFFFSFFLICIFVFQQLHNSVYLKLCFLSILLYILTLTVTKCFLSWLGVCAHPTFSFVVKSICIVVSISCETFCCCRVTSTDRHTTCYGSPAKPIPYAVITGLRCKNMNRKTRQSAFIGKL